MKFTFTSLKNAAFLILFFLSLSFKAKSQKCDLEIFSEGYEKFNLYLNGVAQSDTAKTYYEFFEIPSTYYEVLITFPSSRDTIIKPLSVSPNSKTIYAVVYKEKREKYKLKFRDQTGLSGNTYTYISSNIEAINQPTNQMIKVTLKNPNCTTISGGLNESENLRIRLNTLNYDEEKLNYLRSNLEGNCYLSIHLVGLLNSIKSENYKLELTKLFIDVTYDLENLKIYSPSFQTNEFRDQYLNLIP